MGHEQKLWQGLSRPQSWLVSLEKAVISCTSTTVRGMCVRVCVCARSRDRDRDDWQSSDQGPSMSDPGDIEVRRSTVGSYQQKVTSAIL